MKRTSVSLLVALQLVSVTACLVVRAGAAGTPKIKTSVASVSDVDLANAIREAKAVNPEFPLKLERTGGTCAVWTWRNDKDKPEDVKIDAVFVAKGVIFRDPSIKEVDVHFANENDKNQRASWKVTIPASVIEQFNKGNMNKQALLNVIDVDQSHETPEVQEVGHSPEDPFGVAPPAPGDQYHDRMAMYRRLVDLHRKAGQDTPKLDRLYTQLDSALQSNDKGAVQAALQELRPGLDEAEDKFNRNVVRSKIQALQAVFDQIHSMPDDKRDSFLRQQLGERMPESGPAREERAVLMYELKRLDELGLATMPYRIRLMRVERLAKSGNESLLPEALRSLQKHMESLTEPESDTNTKKRNGDSTSADLKPRGH